MYEITNGIMHGASFVVKLNTIEFLTMRLNEETGEYWLKMHLPSGKDVRIRVSEAQVRDISEQWSGGKSINLNIGDDNGLDKR